MATKFLFKAFEARTQDPLAKIILIFLADSANENGICWPSHKTIAEKCECSVATVKRKLDILVVQGWIDIKPRSTSSGKSSNYYQFIVEPHELGTNGREKGDKIRVAQPELGDSSQRAIEPINEPINKYPTLGEVENYVREKGFSVDAKFFFDYFSESNWVDSRGNKVKNWKQKLITWEKQEKKNGQHRSGRQSHSRKGPEVVSLSAIVNQRHDISGRLES